MILSLSSPRQSAKRVLPNKRGPIRRSFSIGHGVWVPARARCARLAGTTEFKRRPMNPHMKITGSHPALQTAGFSGDAGLGIAAAGLTYKMLHMTRTTATRLP